MKNTNTKTLTRVALLVAIELVMKLVGLGSVPVVTTYSFGWYNSFCMLIILSLCYVFIAESVFGIIVKFA